MKKIPAKILKEILSDPWYSRCCRCGRLDVQLHHVFQYSGMQINEKFNIVPACVDCHAKVKTLVQARRFFERVSLVRSTQEELSRYPKIDWEQKKLYLKIL